jgi:putative acetyltransferase
MHIRPETAADHTAIRNVLIAAFANHPHSQQTEHLIVEALRNAKAMTIGLVAVVENAASDLPAFQAPAGKGEEKVVGHIAFSPAKIDAKDCGWFILGPIAVEPKRQRQGIGQALVNEGLEQLRRLGAEGCILVGDPAYYSRFGFRQNPSLKLEGIPPEVLLCLPMADCIPQGEVTHHAAFFTRE